MKNDILSVSVHPFTLLFSNKIEFSMFLLFIIPLWLQRASTEVLLHTFNTEGQWSAQKIFCHYHVSFAGNGAWEADWQQTAVVQIRAVMVLLSVISEKGFRSMFRYRNIFGSRTLYSVDPLLLLLLLLLQLKVNRRHHCRIRNVSEMLNHI